MRACHDAGGGPRVGHAWVEVDGLARVVYSAVAALCLLPVISGASLSAWELLRLSVVLAAVSYLGWRRRPAGRFTRAQPFVYVFIVGQFCREAPPVVWWVTWGIVGVGLLAATQRSRRHGARAWESRLFQYVLVGVAAVLLALQGMQLAHLILPWREWTLTRDLLVLPLALGVFALGRTATRLAPAAYTVWAMRACAALFGMLLLHGVWQYRVVQSLHAEAQESLHAGAYEAAVDKYLEALSRNSHTVELEAFALENTLSRIDADSAVKVDARAYVRGRILEVEARSREEWGRTLGLYRRALGNAAGVPPVWRDNCRRGIGLALLHLGRWSDLASSGRESMRQQPALLRGWVERCVGLVKHARYQDAVRPFSHVVGVLTVGSAAPADSLQTGRIWSIGGLLGLLPEDCLPFAEALTYGEVVALLESAGLLVLYEDQRIGATDITVPVPVQVLSSGYMDRRQASSSVTVNGVDILVVNGAEVDVRNPEGRGYNLVAIDPEDGSVERVGSFDTFLDARNARKMLEWVQGIHHGHIIAGTVYDEASVHLGVDGMYALRLLGSSGRIKGKYRWAHAVVGVKGGAPGSAAEVLDPRQARLSLIVGNMPETARGLSGQELLTILQRRASAAGKRLAYISGIDRDDQVILVDGESQTPRWSTEQ